VRIRRGRGLAQPPRMWNDEGRRVREPRPVYALHRSTIGHTHHPEAGMSAVDATLDHIGRLLRRAGTAVGSLTARVAAHARRPLSTRQLFAVVLVLLVLLYLFVLLVEPTGAGRGGR
jgi:hypothetical protein